MTDTPPVEINRRMELLGNVFRPSAPVDTQDLFSGRNHQVASVAEAATSAGQHAVIYGERGVGKTSLAAVSAEIQKVRGAIAVRVNCDSADDFFKLWEKVLEELFVVLADPTMEGTLPEGFGAGVEKAAEILSGDVGPSQVRIALRQITPFAQVLIFFDEFDQVADDEALVLFSNTVKTLSDQIEPVTLVAVGVAESVETLIRGHRSIGRALVQVKMPRMTRDEIRTVVTTGLGQLEMTIQDDALAFTEAVPKGMPQYAHLLAQEGARQALIHGRIEITLPDLMDGLRVGLAKLEQSLSSAYDQATFSPRPNRFKEVLLAGALARLDEEGFFSPSNIREPYGRLIGEENVHIARFNPQLVLLCENRGRILTRKGEPRSWRYRFSDALMEPYVLLKGLDGGLISPDDVVRPSGSS